MNIPQDLTQLNTVFRIMELAKDWSGLNYKGCFVQICEDNH